MPTVRHPAAWRSSAVPTLGAILLAALVLVPPRARTQVVQAEIAPEVVSEDRYPLARVRFPSGVVGLPGVVYAREPGFRPLELDLYLPGGSARAPRPFVVFVHGGAWETGSRRGTGTFANWPLVLAALAARGYVVASVDYRLSGEAPFPAALHDVQAALRWLRAHAREHGIDPTRGVIWGASAGGQLAALIATSCGVAELRAPVRAGDHPTPIAPGPSPLSRTGDDCAQAAVIWYGISDLADLEAAPQVQAYLRCDDASSCSLRERAREASPLTYVDPRDPPFLIVHGDADRTVPVAHARVLHDALATRSVRSELVILPGIDHSFVGATPAITRDASLGALGRTFSFLDEIVGLRR